MMSRKLLLPGIAIFGALFALLIVFWSQKKIPTPEILYPPPKPPYTYSISGAGLIEASSKNVSIGSPFSEIVSKIYVCEGDKVKAGDLLFELDTRSLKAQLETERASVNLAITTLEDKTKQFSYYERIRNRNAVSEIQYETAYFAMLEAKNQLQIAKTKLKVIETNIERSIIHSPIDALILQVNINVGEIAPTVPFVSSEATLMLLGRIDPLFLRIDIDEDDAWRYKKGAAAMAYVRGNRNIQFPLKFVRIEPYIIPKASFTGDTTERIDTRVLQILYSFEWGNLPIFPGQTLDVFIQSEAINTSYE